MVGLNCRMLEKAKTQLAKTSPNLRESQVDRHRCESFAEVSNWQRLYMITHMWDGIQQIRRELCERRSCEERPLISQVSSDFRSQWPSVNDSSVPWTEEDRRHLGGFQHGYRLANFIHLLGWADLSGTNAIYPAGWEDDIDMSYFFIFFLITFRNPKKIEFGISSLSFIGVFLKILI